MSTPNPFANMPTTAAQMMLQAQSQKRNAIVTKILNEESESAMSGGNVDVAQAVPNIYLSAAKRLSQIDPQAAQQLYQQGMAAVDASTKRSADLGLIKAQTANLNEAKTPYLETLKQLETSQAQVEKFPVGSATRVALEGNIARLNEQLDTLNMAGKGDPHSAVVAEIREENATRMAEGAPKMTAAEVKQRIDRAHETSSIPQNYNKYAAEERDAGRKPQPYDQWRQGFANTQAMATGLGTGGATAIHELENSAQTAVQGVRPIANAIKLLNDPRMITGTGAEARLGVARLIDTILDRPTPVAQVTDEYVATGGQMVASLLKTGAFGTGASITENDRLYAKKIAGGDFNMSDPALRTLLQHMYEAQSAQVDRYNTKLSKLGEKYSDVADIYSPIEMPKIDFAKPDAPTRPKPGASADELVKFYSGK